MPCKMTSILAAPTPAPAWERTGAALTRSKALNHYPAVAAYTSGKCGVQAASQHYIFTP